VELEAAPYVWRVDSTAGWPVQAHTGQAAEVRSSWLDEHGRLYLDTDLGYGLVSTVDMGVAAQAVEAGHWQPLEMVFARMPGHFGYRLRPGD
jgi:hypothetical protein